MNKIASKLLATQLMTVDPPRSTSEVFRVVELPHFTRELRAIGTAYSKHIRLQSSLRTVALVLPITSTPYSQDALLVPDGQQLVRCNPEESGFCPIGPAHNNIDRCRSTQTEVYFRRVLGNIVVARSNFTDLCTPGCRHFNPGADTSCVLTAADKSNNQIMVIV